MLGALLHWKTKIISWLLFKCSRGGRVKRWYLVIFQWPGVILIWILVGQGPIVLAVGAWGEGRGLDIFLSSVISLCFGDGPI